MSGGRALTFHEDTLLAVHDGLSRNGIWQEVSGVAGLSALKEAIADGNHFNEPIVVILTSGGFKDLVADSESTQLSDTQTIEILINRFQHHHPQGKK
jgi:threonine synthase